MIKKLLESLYISQEKAKNLGFTHHGMFWLVPIWTTADGEYVAAKSVILEPLHDLCEVMESLVRSAQFPDDEPVFTIKIGKKV